MGRISRRLWVGKTGYHRRTSGNAHSPGIIEIAKLAGVSKSTAARALSGHPSVSARSLQRVEAAAERAGYRRNNLAAALRTGRIGIFGLVIPDISNPFWAELARGAQDAAEAHARSVIVLNSDWDAAREERHLASLVATQVEGILISPVTRCTPSWIPRPRWWRSAPPARTLPP